jgi:hypothetical protein
VYAGQDGEPLLAMFVDPMNMVLTVPPFPEGPASCVRFLRELARAATEMADEIRPAEQANRSGGAHRAHATDDGAVR